MLVCHRGECVDNVGGMRINPLVYAETPVGDACIFLPFRVGDSRTRHGVLAHCAMKLTNRGDVAATFCLDPFIV